ncbi:MAG TPA: response regulator [Stellaceae bacterium]|nr:response regulator [Stellaceae bacterium]
MDDDDDVRSFTAMVFEDFGHEVFIAENGAAALDLLDHNPAVSIMFSDVRMPGMSGQELAAEALRRYPALKIILTSGFHGEQPLADIPFISKPWRPTELKRLLDGILNAH